jgi:hypothetical protein
MARADLKSKGLVLDSQDLYCVDVKSFIAECLLHLQRYTESLEQNSVVLDDLTGSGDHTRILFAKIRQSNCLVVLGNFQAAAQLCDEVMADFKDVLAPEHPHLQIVSDIMRRCHLQQGNFLEALRLAKLQFDTSVQSLGERHGTSIITLGLLAATYEYSRQFKQAWGLHQQTLSLMKDTYGLQHSSVNWALYWLSSFARRWKLGRAWTRKCISYSEQLLEQLRHVSEPPEQSTIDLMGCLAEDYFILGHFNKAYKIQEEYLSLTIQVSGQLHQRTVSAKRFLRQMKLGIQVRKVAWFWLPKNVRNI